MIGLAANILMGAALLAAEPQAPQWNTNVRQAWLEARQTSKPLLVVIDVPSDNNRRIQQVSHKPDATQQALLSRYVLAHVDASTRYGRQVAEFYNVTEAPTTLVLRPASGTTTHRQSGQMGAQQWANLLVTQVNNQVLFAPATTYSQPIHCST